MRSERKLGEVRCHECNFSRGSEGKSGRGSRVSEGKLGERK